MRDAEMTWEQAVLRLREMPDQRVLVEACFYDDPVECAAERYSQCGEWIALKQLLPKVPGKALDLGAGRGIVAYALARSGWSVVAAEPDSSAIVGTNAIRSLNQRAGTDIEVVQAAGEALPLPNNSFDLVHCRAVLHHAHDLQGMCREIARVLRPGGILVATREHVISRAADLPTFLRIHPLHRFYGGENAYELKTYLAAISGAGLRVDRVLNPLESDINLFPDSKCELKRRLVKRLRLPSKIYFPDWLLRVIGNLSDAAGRLYTFRARKP